MSVTNRSTNFGGRLFIIIVTSFASFASLSLVNFFCSIYKSLNLAAMGDLHFKAHRMSFVYYFLSIKLAITSISPIRVKSCNR